MAAAVEMFAYSTLVLLDTGVNSVTYFKASGVQNTEITELRAKIWNVGLLRQLMFISAVLFWNKSLASRFTKSIYLNVIFGLFQAYYLVFSFVYLPNDSIHHVTLEIALQLAMIILTTLNLHSVLTSKVPSTTASSKSLTSSTIPLTDILKCFYRDRTAIFYVFSWCSIESLRIILELDASTKLQEGTRMVIEDNTPEAKVHFIKLVFNSFLVIILYVFNTHFVFPRLTTRINIALRLDLFDHLLKQEVEFFDKYNSAEIYSQFLQAHSVKGMIIQFKSLFKAMFTCCTTIFFIQRNSWRVAFIQTLLLPLPVLVQMFAIPMIRERGSYWQKLVDARTKILTESFSNIRTIKSFRAESFQFDRYEDLLREGSAVCMQKYAFQGLISLQSFFSGLMMPLFTVFIAKDLYVDDYNKLFGVILLQMKLQPAIEEFSTIFSNFNDTIGRVEGLFGCLKRVSNKQLPSGKHTVTDLKRAAGSGIKLKNVSFAYASRPNLKVLDGLNLDIPAGRVTALVGPSGCGKSTIMSLLQNFYTEQSGEITIGGIKVKEFDDVFGRDISIVSQEPVLLTGSIKDNINFNQQFSNSEISTATQKANAKHFIEEIPERYDAEVGEKGAKLSGGQKQRIAIARAIIREPKILLLDEATSALDNKSEVVVQQAINQNLGNKTVIVIAHRLTTIQNADKIVVLDKGRVAEQGNHEELMESDLGIYRRLVLRENEDTKEE